MVSRFEQVTAENSASLMTGVGGRAGTMKIVLFRMQSSLHEIFRWYDESFKMSASKHLAGR